MGEILSSWFGGAFFYEGMERWQLWFDNPNKAAVLLAEVAIAGLWLLVFRGRIPALIGLSLFGASSSALVRTFSRGGLVSWLISAMVLIAIGLWRHVSWRRICIAVLAALIVCASAVSVGLHNRISYGMSGNDRSVGNRLELWRTVPQMMHDAPMGWGIGNSGRAYMNWYQDLGRDERYRTLVNSHLTWLVETGIIGTFIWVLLWGMVVQVGLKMARNGGSALCLAEWLCLFVAASFSSVLESWWLWVLPLTLLVYCIFRCRCQEIAGSIPRVACAAICVVAIIWFGLLLYVSDSHVLKCGDRIDYQGNKAECWIVPDVDVLGGLNYPRVIRDAGQGNALATMHIVADVSNVPDNAETIVFCGNSEPHGRRGTIRTIWLSPKKTDVKFNKDDIVVIGELSDAGLDLNATGKVVIVPGMAGFIGNWPEIVSDYAGREITL